MTSKLSDILKLFAFNGGNPPNSSSASHLKPKVIKLNFRDICEIDMVGSSYHEIHELSLNHNHLQSLDGIEQFANLRSLHLNFNRLRSKNELLKVAYPHLL